MIFSGRKWENSESFTRDFLGLQGISHHFAYLQKEALVLGPYQGRGFTEMDARILKSSLYRRKYLCQYQWIHVPPASNSFKEYRLQQFQSFVEDCPWLHKPWKKKSLPPIKVNRSFVHSFLLVLNQFLMCSSFNQENGPSFAHLRITKHKPDYLGTFQNLINDFEQ